MKTSGPFWWGWGSKRHSCASAGAAAMVAAAPSMVRRLIRSGPNPNWRFIFASLGRPGARSGRLFPDGLSLHLDVRVVDDLPPLRDLLLYLRREFLGRVGDRLEAEHCEAVLDVRECDDGLD